MWVDHGFVDSVLFSPSNSIIWLVSNVHHCTSSCNCVYSLIYNSPSWTCLLMGGGLLCTKCTHNMWVKVLLEFSISHRLYFSKYCSLPWCMMHDHPIICIGFHPLHHPLNQPFIYIDNNQCLDEYIFLWQKNSPIHATCVKGC